MVRAMRFFLVAALFVCALSAATQSAYADDALSGPVGLAAPDILVETVVVDADFSSGLPSNMSFTPISTSTHTTSVSGGQLHMAPTASSSSVFYRTNDTITGQFKVQADISQTGGNGNSSAGIVVGNRIFNMFFNNGSYRIYEFNPSATGGFGPQIEFTGNVASGNGFTGPTLHTMEVTTDGDGIFQVSLTNNDTNYNFTRQFPLDPLTSLLDEGYIPGPVGVFVHNYGQPTTANIDNLYISTFELLPPPLTPEPGSLVLFAAAGVGLVGCYWRRRQA